MAHGQSTIDKQAVKAFFLQLQDDICQQLAQEDGQARFIEDAWEREKGGGGRSRVLRQGQVFEQAGVNFSHVFGDQMPASATAHRPELAGRCFEAMGVSLVIHPHNLTCRPRMLTCAFSLPKKKARIRFGGLVGALISRLSIRSRKTASIGMRPPKPCARPLVIAYTLITKHGAIAIFILPHRDETRGVGGLFFDDLNQWPFEQCFAYTQAVGKGFIDAYLPIVQCRKATPYGERERDFQLYRRGRYVEFNLVYDRGTLFGLQSGGRTESILMSMPPMARWEYNWSPEEDTPEARLYRNYLKPREW
ncbi:oxygen-dependent coproporphyrinogen oxidase [Salinivibrio socompensis]|uniref:oxygen-dependent coproporphyrinogen oxidase n=1 Tax=Salinivibrio socompensis TaxID=1510206 RepID=UPI0004BBBE64